MILKLDKLLNAKIMYDCTSACHVFCEQIFYLCLYNMKRTHKYTNIPSNVHGSSIMSKSYIS